MPLISRKYLYSIRRVIENRKLLMEFFKFKEKLLGYPRLKRDFKRRTGYRLNLKTPESFNQKVCWKKVYDRNPLLPVVADKDKVRDYLKDTLGQEEAEKILIPQLYVTDDPESIPFDKLPKEYVIKANHGSGTNIIVEDSSSINEKQIIDTCKNWLGTSYGALKHEWAYQEIERKIVIEKLLRDGEGRIPNDYKFHIFHGKCYMIQVNQGDFKDKDNRTLTLFTRNWEKHDVFWEFKPASHVDPPKNLNNLIAFSEKLAMPFDYVRVDLYSLDDGSIYFGEFTNYPTSGNAVVDPITFDFSIGSKWTVKSKYWEQ
ncbi:ATP-grasp fold amidoligase family protein [Salisediminibacterium halotolerans]|uniref:ATP-grasp fold amidoligase family protein n=1 Tax=Salisediminibacterium halotolerans TaxID=517425 RepID=UPI000EABB8EB|nr:ATP-grasp fold amidoligase family protein [Salisediminibacterium halotolerans]RLJ75711.1 teichuronopeptide biosynthesis TupA-like protein [Actinophytocola xinjiangensis]RPE89565.1 teichuronopeptide biosynthesis TupA-like protein [Salisediminibacterium halotolerans]TWG36324.1 teichuronopeptide biosynthesis TupA-like protein [Salisediminibacterium halotolerans]GEL07228.1 hypothetical protein SHA02_06440 [Salisediminibacterium halotolerans]